MNKLVVIIYRRKTLYTYFTFTILIFELQKHSNAITHTGVVLGFIYFAFFLERPEALI